MDLKPADGALVIGVVGTGTMGQGIAQVAAAAGLDVRLYDAAQAAAQEARAQIVERFARLVEKGRMSDREAIAAGDRLAVLDELSDLASADIVVEAIVEDLEAKQSLFRKLEDVVAADCILATNTSSLSVTAIASACRGPARVAGFHFFNPVPLMKIVEVAEGLQTDSGVAEFLVALGERFGHYAARTADMPGFLVNHAGRGYGTEALRILGEGIAAPADIDRVLCDLGGFRMGPFALFDLVGVDIADSVMHSIYRQFLDEPRFRPSPIPGRQRAAGRLGRKTGRGFYIYSDGKPEMPPEQPVPEAAELPAVWLAGEPDGVGDLAALVADAGAAVDGGPHPEDDSLILVAPLGRDATTMATDLGVDSRRTVAVDTLFGLGRRRCMMTTSLTDPNWREIAHALLARDGTAVTAIHDSPGFIAQRVIACIVNIACDIAQQRIAAPKDIDRAVPLGLGYPQGPLSMGDAIGAARVLSILEKLQAFYGDPRYRPSPWLKRRALLDVSLATPEA